MKEETKNTEKLEREYTIPLRRKFRIVPRYKKTNKAVKTIKEFLAKHMKVEDRDLKKIKIDKFLNDFLWQRGIKNPPHKIKVKAIKEDSGIIRVELAELSKKIEQKKKRLEKRAKISEPEQKKPEKKEKGEDKDGDEVKDKMGEKEKKEATKESITKLEKAQAKAQKHSTKEKGSQQKRPVRKALAK